MRRSAPTPLMLAVLNSHAEAAQVLVDYGMDPIYVYVPNEFAAKTGPQPLSAYEHALLEYRFARADRGQTDVAPTDQDGDGIDDVSMVEVVKEKKWQEITKILATLNDHDRVKRVRMWYAWTSFFRDATVGILFFILFWVLSPSGLLYTNRQDRSLLFALQSKLVSGIQAEDLAFSVGIGWVGNIKILKHAQFLCQVYELRKLNTQTGVEGYGFVAWVGQYTYIAFLFSLFGFTQPIRRGEERRAKQTKPATHTPHTTSNPIQPQQTTEMPNAQVLTQLPNVELQNAVQRNTQSNPIQPQQTTEMPNAQILTQLPNVELQGCRVAECRMQKFRRKC